MSVPPRRGNKLNYEKKCCVYGCENSSVHKSSDDVVFYQFPSGNLFLLHKAMRREEWLAAVRSARPGGAYWVPKYTSKICSEHFVGNKRSDDPRSPSYNPTIFPNVYSEIKVNTEEIMEKHKLMLERQNGLKELMASTEMTRNTGSAKTTAAGTLQLKKKRAKRNVNTKGTQVNFPDESDKEDSPQLFLCCRYCTLGIDKCDAEVQVYRPRAISSVNITIDPLRID